MATISQKILRKRVFLRISPLSEIYHISSNEIVTATFSVLEGEKGRVNLFNCLQTLTFNPTPIMI